MPRTTRLARSFIRLLLPVVLLLVVAVCAASVWLVYKAARPAATSYLVRPENYGRLSARGAQVTDETWANPAGTPSRLSNCFAATTQVETRLDLSPSGFSIIKRLNGSISPRPMINE